MNDSPEYWRPTGPDDPHTVIVLTRSLDNTSGEPAAVHLFAEYAGKPAAHLSLAAARARNIGHQLIRAADALDARQADNETFDEIVFGPRTTAEEDAP